MNRHTSPIYHVGKYAEHFKRSPRFKEFEVSNLGRIRRVGELRCIEPYWDETYGQWRVHLVTPMGKSKVNVANMVAEIYHGERARNQRVAWINGNVHDNTAMNLRYETIERHLKTREKAVETPSGIEEIKLEELNGMAAEMTQAGIEPQYIVLDVGAIAMTVSLEMAYGIAGIQGLDIYRLKKRGTGNMTVWTLGDKVE